MRRTLLASSILCILVCTPIRAQMPASLPASPASNPTSSVGKELTLAQAEAFALKNNPQITIGKLRALVAHQYVREARSAFLPNAYLSVTAGAPDMLAHAMLGYGLLQALLLLRLLPWIRQQPFAPSYWALTFGATTLAAVPLDMMERGTTGAVASIAPYLFVAANIVVALIALATVRLTLQGRLLPKAAPSQP